MALFLNDSLCRFVNLIESFLSDFPGDPLLRQNLAVSCVAQDVLVGCRDEFRVIFPARCPNHRTHQIVFAEHLVADLLQRSNFGFVDRDKNSAFLPQQILCQLQARIHHIKPVRVETSCRFGVGGEFAIAITLTGYIQIGANRIHVVVFVDQVFSRVIRRININHLDLAVVMLLKDLQDFQVVPFNDHVLRVLPVHRVLMVGCKCGCGWSLSGPDRLRFTWPEQPKTLNSCCCIFSQHCLKRGDVDLSIHNDLWEQLCQFLCSVSLEIGGAARDFIDLVAHCVLR